MKKVSLVTMAGLIVLCLATAGTYSAPVQVNNRGALNTWTTRVVERRHETAETAYTSYLKVVRAEKHSGFDRAVFEFTGPMPNYNIHYLATPFYVNEDDSKERIRIAGRAFILAGFYFIRADETQLNLEQAKGFFPQGKLRMPVFGKGAMISCWE